MRMSPKCFGIMKAFHVKETQYTFEPPSAQEVHASFVPVQPAASEC